MTPPTYDPTATIAGVARTIEGVARALRYAPEAIADAMRDHEQQDEGNEWSPIECPSLLGDAAYYAHEERPALVVWMHDDEGFMFIEGHPDDARDSAANCRAEKGRQHPECRAWWVNLADERPEWREVGA